MVGELSLSSGGTERAWEEMTASVALNGEARRTQGHEQLGRGRVGAANLASEVSLSGEGIERGRKEMTASMALNGEARHE